MKTNDTRRAVGTIAATWSVGALAAVVPALMWPERVDSLTTVLCLAVASVLTAGLFLHLGRRILVRAWALMASEVAGIAAIALLVVAGGSFAGVYAQLMSLVAVKAALHLQLRAAVTVLCGVVGTLAALVATDQLLAADAWVASLVAVAVAVPAYRYALLVRTSEARLAAQDQWWRASIGGFAHDARSPLSTILGLVDLLEQHSDDDRVDVAELAGGVRRSAGRVLALAEDLIDLQRVDDGKLVLQEETIGAAQLLHRVAATTSTTLEVRADCDVVIHGDVPRLEQVLRNLVSNATKYGKAPVVMFAQRDGDDVLLGVRDHGPGVPAELLPQLFSRFGRGDHDGSTGLGLWICEQLVLAHGGDLSYTSADPGAQFVARLPGAAEPPHDVPDLVTTAALRS